MIVCSKFPLESLCSITLYKKFQKQASVCRFIVHQREQAKNAIQKLKSKVEAGVGDVSVI